MQDGPVVKSHGIQANLPGLPEEIVSGNPAPAVPHNAETFMDQLDVSIKTSDAACTVLDKALAELEELNLPSVTGHVLAAQQQLDALRQKLTVTHAALASRYTHITDLHQLMEDAEKLYDQGPTPRARFFKGSLSNLLVYGTVANLLLITGEPLLYLLDLTNIAPAKFFSEKISTDLLFAAYLLPYLAGALTHFVNRSLNSNPVVELVNSMESGGRQAVHEIPKLRSFSRNKKHPGVLKKDPAPSRLAVKRRSIAAIDYVLNSIKSSFYMHIFDRLQKVFNLFVNLINKGIMPLLTGTKDYAFIRQVSEKENLMATVHLAGKRAVLDPKLSAKLSITSNLCLAASWFLCELLVSRLLGFGGKSNAGMAIGLSFMITAAPWAMSFLQSHLISGANFKHPLLHASAHLVDVAIKISEITLFSYFARALDFLSENTAGLLLGFRSSYKSGKK